MKPVKWSVENPWNPSEQIESDTCWHCHEGFTDADFVKVVDSVEPKLVHDREPCANAMFQKEGEK
jgi:hypothetical protein